MGSALLNPSVVGSGASRDTILRLQPFVPGQSSSARPPLRPKFVRDSSLPCSLPYAGLLPAHSTRPQRLASPLAAFAPHTELYHTADEPIGAFGFATDFNSEYELGKRLGAGTFGTVYEATRKSTGEVFAVKRMPKRFASPGVLERYFVRRIRNEVDICNHLGRSLNVAYLYAAYEDKDNVDLVMELCSGGELWDAIKARGGAYSERDAARLVGEVLRTVAQCHSAGVLMRDVKPENFLFASKDPDAPLKAIDFGISVFCNADQEVDMRAGTPIYIAPDVLRCRYSHPADMWSVGIVAYMLLTGRLPFTGEEGDEVAELYMSKHVYNNKDVFRAVLYADLDFESAPWDVISPEAKELVSSLLHREADKRPTAEEAVRHPWLTGGSPSAVPLGDSIVQRLQRYGTYGRLKQAALRKVAHAALAHYSQPGLPEALQAAFAAIDRQGTGRIPLADLRAELRSGHFNLTDAEAGQLVAQVDIDEDGSVDWEEWVAAMMEWRAVRDSTEWDALVTEAFRTMDRDSDAALGVDDLTALLCGDEDCDPDIVEAALRECDTDHDRTVSLDDLRMLLGTHDTDLDLFDARVAGKEDHVDHGHA